MEENIVQMEENIVQSDSAKALKRDDRLQFFGGMKISLLPFLIFLIGSITASALGYANARVFWIIAMIALVIGMALSKNKLDFFEAILDGMTEKLTTTAILCWVWAGAFGGMLKASGLVEGLIWLGVEANLTGGLFCGFTFILGAIYGTSVGSGWATITGLALFMYPAGIALGADPMVLAGSIVSAGCFGDNLGPVSDTTIISSATMERSISDVVKSRLPITLIAGGISLVLLCILGGGGEALSADVAAEVIASAHPLGLVMLIPAALVIVLALKGWNLVQAITCGMIAVMVIGLPLNLFTFEEMFTFADGSVDGPFISGITGFLDLILLVILATGLSYIMQAGGSLELLLNKLKKLAKSVRSAEIINWLIVSVAAFALSHSVISIIVAAPLVRSIGDAYKINRCRLANFCDSVHCMWSYTMPWTGATLLLCQMTASAAETYDFVAPITNPIDVMPYCIHCFVLGGVFLLSAITGFGRKFEK